MAKTLGIITEYDPYHKGHAYFLDEAKRLSGADRIVAVMSGSFMQRGEPALFDKYLRAEAAVRNGVDLVIELPFAYGATGPENFAHGGIRLLSSIGVVNAIAFGSESARIEPMKELAGALAFENAALSRQIAEGLATGVSYPAARHEAVAAEIGGEAAELLVKPNDILAVEYLKQLYLIEAETGKRGLICFHPGVAAKGEPLLEEIYAVERKGPGPNGSDQELRFAGAGAIRALLREGRLGEAFSYMPAQTAELIQNRIHEYQPDISVWEMRTEHDLRIETGLRWHTSALGMVFPEALFDPFQFALLSIGPRASSAIYTAAEGVENRLFEAAMRAKNYYELVALVKSKRFTESRIRRLVLHTALRLSKADMKRAMSERICGRILAFNDTGAEILRDAREADAPARGAVLYQNLRVQEDELSKSPALIELSVRADKLYHMMVEGNLIGYRYSPEPVRV
ncbi:MAG: nucleotidyltransferase family protein [Clostridiales Family XIII bacterium]|jgi:predicted nucleotidyltransferase|nr:nucleotidyltransferase family protein [Clostridiales Family XIII bacterium]